MNFLKGLFGGKKEPPQPVRGLETKQGEDEQSSTRNRMETEMVASREQRSAASSAGNSKSVGSITPSEREHAIFVLVTQAFPGRDLQVSTVDVRNLEGGTVSTMRFTLDNSASTDLETARIAHGDEPLEVLARAVVADLQSQS